MEEQIIEHDEWNYGIPKLQRASKIELGHIYGVLPFDGVRNPSSRSSTAHRVFLTYKTAANDWKPKVGICESSAEAAVAFEALISASTHDLHFQPLTVDYRDEDGRRRQHTFDLLITNRNGHRRLVFVRNAASLEKPKTQREIQAIAAATPKQAADDLIVVDANEYTRQRRENLFRMYRCAFEPDPEADEIVLSTARRLKTLWHMKDLFPHVPIPQHRAFAACYRLVGQRYLRANLDQVLWERSRIEVAA